MWRIGRIEKEDRNLAWALSGCSCGGANYYSRRCLRSSLVLDCCCAIFGLWWVEKFPSIIYWNGCIVLPLTCASQPRFCFVGLRPAVVPETV